MLDINKTLMEMTICDCFSLIGIGIGFNYLVKAIFEFISSLLDLFDYFIKRKKSDKDKWL